LIAAVSAFSSFSSAAFFLDSAAACKRKLMLTITVESTGHA
jgi:hypothetical protein